MPGVVLEPFEWRASPVPVGVPVRQVYGWLVGDCGRVLLQDVGNGYNLPGGRPERCDDDMAGMLRREAMEETSFGQAARLLCWGRSGFVQAEAASRVAALWWCLPVDAPPSAVRVG